MAEDPASTDVRRYRVRGVLGRGGFGTVYLADMLGQSGFTRAVALKVLNADMAAVPSVAERLRDEARLLGLLRHRAIVNVDGLVRLDGRWTIVMEYVEGVPLSALIAQGALPIGPAVEVAGEIAAALHVAFATQGPTGQAMRLLHRDVKPQNVLVTPVGETKVLDFGVARAEFEGREAKTRNMLLGSVGYMAPERFDLEDGPAADVYSVGVVLWEMATGHELGRASTKRDKHEAFVAAGIRTLEAVEGVTPGTVELVAQMLAYDPADRPQARDVERRCRDLRLGIRGPWLRDWAERAVPPLLLDPDGLAPHDFSSDVLSEVKSLGTGSVADDAPAPVPRRPLPTFTPDFLDDDAPSVAPPPAPDPTPSESSPPSVAATPAEATPRTSTWAEEVGELAAARVQPDRAPRTGSRRSRRRGPGGAAIMLQAFGGATALFALGGAIFVGMFFLCCCMAGLAGA